MKREVKAAVKERQVGRLVLVLLCLGCAFALGFTAGRGGGWEPVVLTSVRTEYRIVEDGADGTAAPSDSAQTGLRLPTESNPLDLNTATEAQLELLPGIGPALADAILTYRAEFGPFVTKEQLMEVPGIGEKRYEAVEKLIYVEETP